jgi:hypothetical protein
MLPVSIRQIEEEIKALETELAYKESVRPPHDHSGAYEREVFELEEALAEKLRALAEMTRQEQERENDISRT